MRGHIYAEIMANGKIEAVYVDVTPENEKEEQLLAHAGRYFAAKLGPVVKADGKVITAVVELRPKVLSDFGGAFLVWAQSRPQDTPPAVPGDWGPGVHWK